MNGDPTRDQHTTTETQRINDVGGMYSDAFDPHRDVEPVPDEIVPAMRLQMGERFLVEPSEGEPFVATLRVHLGWGLVNGQILLECLRDGVDEPFTYEINHQAAVKVVKP